jgi:hypothetical protein
MEIGSCRLSIIILTFDSVHNAPSPFVPLPQGERGRGEGHHNREELGREVFSGETSSISN